MQCFLLTVFPALAVASAITLFAETQPTNPAPLAPQATPARDGTQPRATAGTAIVRGRITAAATGQPLHRVRVTLNGRTQNPPTGVTDAEGRYEIRAVPAGSYSVTAARAGYLTIQLGQRRPRERGRTLEIEDAATVERIDIALHRGSVLAGRITDELGEPAPDVRLEAMEMRYLRGRRILLQAGSATSNDNGQFRITGLEPGTYQLRASTTETWEGDDEKREGYAYAQTYYPGTSRADDAQGIALTVGQEAAGLEFPLSVARAALGGSPLASLTTPRKPRPDVTVVVFADDPGRWGLGSRFVKMSRPTSNGTFLMSSLPEGTYRIMARESVVDGQWEDREFLASVHDTALRFELTDGSVKELTLK